MSYKSSFLLFFLLSSSLSAAVVQLNGKQFDCTKKSSSIFHCPNGDETIVLKKSFNTFVAVSLNPKNGLEMYRVNKVVDGFKVLYATAENSYSFDTFGTSIFGEYDKINVAESALLHFKDADDPAAKAIYDRAVDMKKQSNQEELKQISIALNETQETLQCVRGESHKVSGVQGWDAKLKCDYYSCSTMGSDDKILAFLPNPTESFLPPSILRMKGEQAELINSDFTVRSKNNLTVLDSPKMAALPVLDENVDPKLFIPSKYQKSQTSFSYLNTFGPVDYDDNAARCADSNVKKLISERNKIGNEMRDHIASADIVEYLRMDNGNIRSYYVDKQKANSLGCEYNNKILDSKVVENIDYLKKISSASHDKKYIELAEVQELFKKARDMKDIPFGYKYDGCYARAHIMARRFEAEGIPTQKVWIKGDLSVPGTDIQWNYHVAPVVDVKTTDGKIEKYVIDPSLTDKAVPIDEWVATMKANVKGPVMKTTYPFPANSVDFQRTTVALSSSDPFAPQDIREMKEDEKMLYAQTVLKEFSDALKEKQ